MSLVTCHLSSTPTATATDSPPDMFPSMHYAPKSPKNVKGTDSFSANSDIILYLKSPLHVLDRRFYFVLKLSKCSESHHMFL